MNLIKRMKLASKTYAAYREVFSSPEGKLILMDLMKSCYMDKTSVGQTPYDTYFNEGARSVILRIMQTCKMSQSDITKLIDDMKEQEELTLGGLDEIVQ